MKSNYILGELEKLFPNPKCELTYNKDYELLLKTMLSAQTTDKRVNMVTDPLFKKYDSLEKLSTLSLTEVENYIKSIGMYKTKAKNFVSIVSSLLPLGYVPCDRAFLESLKGVGRKTTNVVLSNLYNIPCIAVDTHVHRTSIRLGLVKENDSVLETEEKLMKKFPKESYSNLHHSLVLFGRYICKSKNPSCNICPFKENCKYYKCVNQKNQTFSS